MTQTFGAGEGSVVEERRPEQGREGEEGEPIDPPA